MDSKSAPQDSVNYYMSALLAKNEARIGFVVPSEGTVTLTSDKNAQVNGAYIATAIGGIICNPRVTSGEPISGKTINGISNITDYYTRTQKNQMASLGMFIVDNINGTAKIRHALSTNMATAITSELKITRIKDVVSKTLRTNLEAAYINTRNVGSETLASIKSSVTLLLSGFLSTKDLVAFQNLNVVSQPGDPRQINVSVEIKPVFDVNWILISLSVTI
jgi:archaellum component FlaG (FlaF/FlaG flagellin family)